MLKFVSQKGQDEWVIKDIFNYKTNGYFVDLAASDGVHINNTILMERHLEWTGICIEPNPGYTSKLKNNRKCIIADDVVDEGEGTVLFRIDNGELGGIVAEDTDNNHKYRSRQLKRATVVKRETTTLDKILDKYQAPNIIDYLSLDVEGAETRILRNFPFDRYTFMSMTIERPTIELEDILFKNGYVFVMKSKKCPYDAFYVHKTIPNFDEIQKEPYSPTPPKNW